MYSQRKVGCVSGDCGLVCCCEDDRGLVTCVADKRHLFDVGDYVTFSEVKGMTQLNAATHHPVTDVHGILNNNNYQSA